MTAMIQPDLFGNVQREYAHEAVTEAQRIYAHPVTPANPDPLDIVRPHWSGYRASEHDPVATIIAYYVNGQKGRVGIPPHDVEKTRELGYPVSADTTLTWGQHRIYRDAPGWAGDR